MIVSQEKIKEFIKEQHAIDGMVSIHDFELWLEEQPRVGEWIPASERLPEDESIMYWTTHEDGSLVMHGYTKKNGFIYNWEVDDLGKRKRQGDVIAWMPLPLPEPYKEGEDE